MGLLDGIRASNALFEPVNAGIAQGTERRRQMGLASLMAGVAQGGTPDYQGVAKLGGDPLAFQKADRGNIEQQAKEVAQYAKQFLSLPPDQKPLAYPQLAQMVRSLRLPHPDIPDTYDPSFDAGIANLQALGGADQDVPAGVQEFKYFANGLSPEDDAKARRVHLGLDARPPSGLPYQFVKTVGSDGVERVNAYDKREGAGKVLDASGVPHGGNPPNMAAALAIAEKHGFQPTSVLRTPGENARLPGASAHSRHLTGDALDVSIRGKSPAELAQFDAEMQAAGYKGGIHLEGSFPHMHYSREPSAGVNPFASRPAEQQAGMNTAAQEQAKVDVQVGNANRVGNAAGEVKAGEAVGADLGAQFNQIQQKASLAQAENSKLIPLRSLLSKSVTGPGANAYLGAQRAAAMLGFDVKGLGEAEAARAISNQLALQLRNPAGGEGMPGAMSDADRNFLVSSIPSLQNTPQGWRTLIDMRLSLNQYAIRQAQQAEQMRRNGVPVQDIPGKMREWAQANPIFKPQPRRAPPAGFRVLD